VATALERQQEPDLAALESRRFGKLRSAGRRL